MVGLKKIYNMFELADEMSNYSIDDVESAIEILETPIEKQLIQVCKNMLEAGVSLTEIVKCVPRTSISDIYHLGERYLGIDVNVSDEELKLIEEEDKSKK